jgi:hypothetical protein
MHFYKNYRKYIYTINSPDTSGGDDALDAFGRIYPPSNSLAIMFFYGLLSREEKRLESGKNASNASSLIYTTFLIEEIDNKRIRKVIVKVGRIILRMRHRMRPMRHHPLKYRP